MRTRISQLWSRLKEIHLMVTQDILASVSSKPSAVTDLRHLEKALQRMQASPTTYGNTGARSLLSSLVTALCGIVRHTDVSPDMFDEALEMVEPMLGQPEVHSAFVDVNPDAVWLCDFRRGKITIHSSPLAPQNAPWRFVAVAG